MQNKRLEMDTTLLKANHQAKSQANFNKELLMTDAVQKKQIANLQQQLKDKGKGKQIETPILEAYPQVQERMEG